MIETINGKAYFKVGDKVYELGGGSNIITADSVEQLPDPASVPEGTIALVPSTEDSGSGGGLPVVELTTQITLESVFTEAENAALTAAFESGMPFILKCSLNFTAGDAEIVADSFRTVAATIDLQGMRAISFNYSIQSVMLVFMEGVWMVMVQ